MAAGAGHDGGARALHLERRLRAVRPAWALLQNGHCQAGLARMLPVDDPREGTSERRGLKTAQGQDAMAQSCVIRQKTSKDVRRFLITRGGAGRF